MNILFTSVGRRVELLQAFRDAFKSLNVKGQIVAIDIDPLAPALKLADRFYLVPRLDSPEYISTLLNVCRDEQIDLIFPLIDPDIPVLARHRSEIEKTGAQLAVVSQEAAEIVSDKWLTYQFFGNLKVPSPLSWLPTNLEPSLAQYPLFIKPRFGSAAKHTYRIDNPSELIFFSSYVPDPIIQEYVTGTEITCDVSCDLAGDVFAVVQRKRIEVRWGEVAKGVTVNYPEITAACLRIAKKLPARGPITVQCIVRDGLPHFTEINARFGGGMPLGIAAGVNAPRWILARMIGLPVDIPPLGTYETGLYMTRYDSSYFLTEADYDQVASHHL